MATPSKTTTRGAASPWSLHANALNLMAQRGETTAMKRAIDSGADINETDRDWFPLMMAVATNNEEVVSLLLRNGAEVDKTDSAGLTSLALAVQEGHVKPMTMLLEHGAGVDRCNVSGTAPLFLACSNGDEEAVKVLVEHGADVNLRKRQTGATPLHAAVRRGASDVCRFLLCHGADANIADESGATPLLAAVENEAPPQGSPQRTRRRRGRRVEPLRDFPETLRDALCETLLAGGADADQTSEKHTPLTASCQRGSLVLAKRLLDVGADANSVDGQGRPPLLVAASLEDGPDDLCELLLQKGAQVDGTDGKGATPLHAAVYRGRLGLVRLLLSHGADVNAATRSKEELELCGIMEEEDSADTLTFPPQFTPLRLATCAEESEASHQILDELVSSGAIEVLDEQDIRSPDDVARWFRAQSWHGPLATDAICDRLANGSQTNQPVSASELFALSEVELDALLSLDEVNKSLRFVETTKKQLSTSLKPQLASRLWHRKIQRHALLQVDRDERIKVSSVVGTESDAALHDPPDNENARSEVVRGLRSAAAAYARATARRVVEGDDVLSPEPDLNVMRAQLDSAAQVCSDEHRRLSEVREALRTQKYEALGSRWSSLIDASDRCRRNPASMPAQPPPRADATSTWWRAEGKVDDCPFDAESGDAARKLHLRARAAAARPVLYGALQGVVDQINAAAHPCELGLSGLVFPLPFADERALLVGGTRRCDLVAVPTRPPRSADSTAACVSCRVEAEDPYVLACLCALLDKGDLPLRVERSRARLLERQAHAWERTSIDVQVTVTYPSDPDAYKGTSVEAPPVTEEEEEAVPPPETVPDEAVPEEDVVADAPVPAPEEAPSPEEPVAESPGRLKDVVERVMDGEVVEEPAPPAFDESLAGADLALATIRLGLASYNALETHDEPFRRIASLTDENARRKHLFSHKLPFLDPDTWQLRTPEDVERLRSQRGAEVVQEDDIDKLRASNAAQHDKIVLMRRAAAKSKRDHADQVAKTSEELSATRDALERATAALAARADDVAALEAELARLRQAPAAPASPAKAPSPVKPSPAQRRRKTGVAVQASTRMRRGGARVAPGSGS